VGARTASERTRFGRHVRTWLPLAGAAGLIAIAALASRTTSGVTSGMVIDRGVVQTLLEVVAYSAVLLGIVLFFVAMAFRRRRQLVARRVLAREPQSLRSRIGALLLPLVILALQIGAYVLLTELFPSDGRATPWGDLWPPVGQDPNALEASRDPTSFAIAFAIVTALVVVAIAVAIRWRRSDAALATEHDDRREIAAQAVELSLDALRREPDPRRAIIAAYAAMERSMSRAGLGREPSEAPIEYLRRMLAGAMADPGDVRTMTYLFEVAKFSDHPVDESMRGAAIQALDRISIATLQHA
jgi:uncharacterized protein DUF4129